MLKITTCQDENLVGDEISLDELAREGARRLIVEALELEVAQYILAAKEQKDKLGHALVVRNGKAKSRKIILGCGQVEIRSPRVNDRREGKKFSSYILPPYIRRSPKVSEVLPILYLKGLSSGDFAEALECLVGKEAKGMSATTITRLKTKWLDEYQAWKKRYLGNEEYIYIWADGVNVSVRLGDDPKLCLLVVIGATKDGRKELLAVEDGYRESKESWAEVLRDLKRRGMKTPLLMIADGNLGIWGALRDTFPETLEQRCWVHKIANVLDKLPKRLQGKVKSKLHDIMNASTRDIFDLEVKHFAEDYEAKYPKAVDCLLKDLDKLSTFYDFPAEHWIHLRTTNPIESTFATVKQRTKVTKGAGSRETALTMAFKLLVSAEKRWRYLNSRHLVQKVLEGVIFKDGVEQQNEYERVVA